MTADIPDRGRANRAAGPRMERVSGVLRAREMGVFLALVVMCIALAMMSDRFFTVTNLFNVGRQISLLGIMAIGMTFVLTSGEVDLSVGSTYALSGLATGMVLIGGYGLAPALIVGIGCGLVVGMINGILSTYGRLPSLIATLGTLSMVRGIALIITDGRPVTVNERNGGVPQVIERFEFLGQGQVFGFVPMQLVFFAAFAAAGWFLLTRSAFGFRVFAVGGSKKAARISGISVSRVKIAAFTLMGGLAATAGILSLAFLPSGQAGRMGLGLELDVIAAAIIGGTSLSGGEGTVIGTILGVLIIGVLRNGLVLVGVSPFVQEFLIGLVIVIAVAIDRWTRMSRAQ